MNKGLPLLSEIRQVKEPSLEKIKELYGDFGVDLFIGKTPSLTKNKSKSKNPLVNLFNRVKDYFSQKAEFEPDDTMFRVVNKYIFNEKSGLTKDIEQKFGKSGMKVFKSMQKMGYVT